MKKPGIRTRRVAELIQEEIGRILIQEFQDGSSGLLTVTGVDVTPDLLSARITLSVFGSQDPQAFLERLERSKGLLRKALASRVKLKYNPQLFFVLDRSSEHQERIDRLIDKVREHDD
jgi:ribosome-binding factor A